MTLIDAAAFHKNNQEKLALAAGEIIFLVSSQGQDGYSCLAITNRASNMRQFQQKNLDTGEKVNMSTMKHK